ncbi:MAG: glycine cleavage system protein GcvH [Bdellovibrionales bacterium]|nr:glycine cleavage system protein GcvH [Bdellovibrionales bacterium]
MSGGEEVFPQDLRYTKEHEWVRQNGDTVTCGITSFAQEELGEIVFVELPKVGEKFSQNATLCVVESTKAASDVYAPVGGVVREVNEVLRNSPETINSDPYGNGWMVQFEGVSSSEIEGLMTAEQYQAHLQK